MTKKMKIIRDPKIDFIKGFAIFLVVWGHAIQYLNNGEFDFFKHPIFIFIYSFHMPLFMFISGYLFSYSLNKINNILCILGKYSLGIYIITGYMFELLNRITVPFINNMYIYNFIITPTASIIMIYISVIISKKIQNNKLLNTLLFGGK